MIIEAKTLSMAPATQPGIQLFSLSPPSWTPSSDRTPIEATITCAPHPFSIAPTDIIDSWGGSKLPYLTLQRRVGEVIICRGFTSLSSLSVPP